MIGILDKGKLTTRHAAASATGFAAVLGVDLNVTLCATSRSSIQRKRQALRKELGEKIKNEFFSTGPLTVHWDGKQLRDINEVRKVDRLTILGTGCGKEHLLAVAKFHTGRGVSRANAVCQTLKEWNIEERVKCMNFDTTLSNSEIHQGACVLIEEYLARELLHLACRHHVDEIVRNENFWEV